MRGPAGEAGQGADPTLPLPAGTVTPRRDYHPPEYRRAVPDLRRRRARRLLRRLTLAVVMLIVLGMLAFGGLLIVTPSVGNARQLVAAQDLAHHAAYPGPAVPARFAESLVATEDKRFYSEPGIDLFAVGRVGFAYLTGRGIQGGATLYQQLAKLLYTQGRSSAPDEAEQVALAVKLYLTYTRQQILQMYADVVYVGNGDYGLAAASCGYFGVRPAGLSWPQAAMLAGLVQGPSLDDPLTHPANAREREVHVVGRLVATGKLTPAQSRAVLAVPLRRLIARAGLLAVSLTTYQNGRAAACWVARAPAAGGGSPTTPRFMLRVQERWVSAGTWTAMLTRAGFAGVTATTTVAEAGLVTGRRPNSPAPDETPRSFYASPRHRHSRSAAPRAP